MDRSRRGPRAAALALVGLLLVACGGGGGTNAPDSGGVPGASGAVPSSAPSGGGAASPAAGTFTNPVLLADFPDPFVFHAGDVYYAYGTGGAFGHLQAARSPDLATWEQLADPLPTRPAWSSGDTWAPEVVKIGDRYVLYYTAHDPDAAGPDATGAQCLSRAVADTPQGPFVDDSKKPFVCQGDLGGSIDATYFKDEDDSAYLIWKNDGNDIRLPTRFFIQKLSGDGLSVEGKASDLGVVNDAEWEGTLIEAPTLLSKDGTYYLFYSANAYNTEFYAVGYATSKKLLGPYKDATENPIVASGAEGPDGSSARGPGHQSIVADDDGELWMAYHAWDASAVGYENKGIRTLWIDPLLFTGGKPQVEGPNDDPQPVP
jgi:beta-xylosidase